MNIIKEAVRSLTPPILWDQARNAKHYFERAHSVHVGVFFEGPISSWEEAAARSDGWDSSVITNKTFDVALRVRDGVIEFEQDTIVSNKITYSATILAFILIALSRHKNNLDIVDFGGSLGTNYFQNRKILLHLADTPFTWNIIERPTLAKLGMERFADARLKFFSGLDEALSGLVDVPDSFLFSGSLQYLREPFAVLDQVISAGAKLLAFDRLLVWPKQEHAVFIQHPDPTRHYPATYPLWCFSKELFVGYLVSRGFTLVEHFTPDPDVHFDHCGMVFTLDSVT